MPDAFRRALAAFAKAATDFLRSLCRLVGRLGLCRKLLLGDLRLGLGVGLHAGG